MRWAALALATLSIAAVTISSLALASPASAIVWAPQFSDSFNRADGPIGNGWIDPQNRATIASGIAQLAYGGGGAPWAETTLRPPAAAGVDQQITVDSPPGNDGAGGNGVFAVLRFQDGQNLYWAAIYSGSLYMGRIEGGAQHDLAPLGTTPISPAFTTADSYRLTFSVTGTSPTTLEGAVRDLDTDAIVSTATYTDSQSALQAAGQSGVYSVTAGSTPWAISNFTTYAAAAESYTLSGPSAASLSQESGAYTVTPDGEYTGTITPSSGGAGGTFTPASLSFTDSTSPQTFTYTPGSTGTPTIRTTSSPALTDPAGLSLTVTDPLAGVVGVANSNLAWSPYTWQLSGSSWAQTSPGGGYVNVAFTGSSLGLNIDSSMLGSISPSAMVLTAYIDGSSTPTTRTFADAVDDQITFSSSLGAGDHYGTIYLSSTPFGVDRWTGPADALRVTSLQLATDGTGSALPLAATPLSTTNGKLLFFGDSITEGYLAGGAEHSYAADVGHDLGMAYGQVAYSGAGWSRAAPNNVPFFYDAALPAQSSWRHFSSTASRLVDPADLSSGFLDGTPDAVYENMGINDANAGVPAAELQTKTTAWLSDIRATIGARPAVFVVVPFNLSAPSPASYATYKAALLSGVEDYRSSHLSDTRVFVIDLGTSGYDIVQVHSTDTLHPDAAGSALLATAIEAESEPYISTVLTPGAISTVDAATQTTASLTVSGPTGGIEPYHVQWYRSTTPGFAADADHIIDGATSATLSDSGLAPGATYYYLVDYGDSTDPDQSATSGEFTLTTLPTVVVVPPVPEPPIPSPSPVASPLPGQLPPAPSNAIAISGSTHNEHGTIVLRLRLPGAGIVNAFGTHDDAKRASSAKVLLEPGSSRSVVWSRRRVALGHAGSVRITLTPNAAGDRMLRQARSHKRSLSVRVWLTYTPDGGTSSSRPLTIRVRAAARR